MRATRKHFSAIGFLALLATAFAPWGVLASSPSTHGGTMAATESPLVRAAVADARAWPYALPHDRLSLNSEVRFRLAALESKPPPDEGIPPLRRKVVCLGDSITKQGYPELLGTRLGVEAINAGVGGQTSRAGLARLERDVLSLRPDAVVILFGTNDSRLDAPGVTVSPEAYEANLRTMIERCQAAKAVVVVCTLPPIDPALYFQRHARPPFDAAGGFDAVIARYRAAAIRAAEFHHVPLVDLNQVLKEDPAWHTADGVHPSASGKERIAELVAREVAARLGLPAPARDRKAP